MKSIVNDYGADPSGATDSYAAIQAALDNGKELECPAGLYRSSGELYMRKPAVLVGERAQNTTFVTSANICLNVQRTSADFDGFGIHGIHFAPSTPGSGSSAIRFITLQDSEIVRQPFVTDCVVSPFGGAGIVSVCTASSSIPSAFFGGNKIAGGLALNNVGDSIVIERNVIFGDKVGVFATFAPGAANMTIVDNNMTAEKEQIYLTNAQNAAILRNQMEQFNGYTGTGDAMIFLQRGLSCVVGDCNNMNTHGHTNGARLLDCRHSSVVRNTITVDPGFKHVWETGGASNVKTPNRFIEVGTGEVPGNF